MGVSFCGDGLGVVFFMESLSRGGVLRSLATSATFPEYAKKAWIFITTSCGQFHLLLLLPRSQGHYSNQIGTEKEGAADTTTCPVVLIKTKNQEIYCTHTTGNGLFGTHRKRQQQVQSHTCREGDLLEKEILLLHFCVALLQDLLDGIRLSLQEREDITQNLHNNSSRSHQSHPKILLVTECNSQGVSSGRRRLQISLEDVYSKDIVWELKHCGMLYPTAQ